ncbi:hypothetical protein BC2230_60242 [Burkholderia cepacia]
MDVSDADTVDSRRVQTIRKSRHKPRYIKEDFGHKERSNRLHGPSWMVGPEVFLVAAFYFFIQHATISPISYLIFSEKNVASNCCAGLGVSGDGWRWSCGVRGDTDIGAQSSAS